MSRLIFSLLLVYAVYATAASAVDRADILRWIAQIKETPNSAAILCRQLLTAARQGNLPADLVDDARAALYAVVRSKENTALDHGLSAALALDALGEQNEEVQMAIVLAMRGAFPFRKGRYRDFGPQAAENISQIRNPSEAIVDQIVELSRYAGDNRGAAAALGILVVWRKKGEPRVGWIDARAARILEGSVWTVEFWAGEVRRYQHATSPGSAGRADTAGEILDSQVRVYRLLKTWWPDVAHTAPKIGDLNAAPGAPLIAEDAQEHRHVQGLASHRIRQVENSARALLKFARVTFATLVALDRVRNDTQIDSTLRDQITVFLRVSIVPYLYRFLHEEPKRMIEIAGVRANDQTSACLVFLAASGSNPRTIETMPETPLSQPIRH